MPARRAAIPPMNRSRRRSPKAGSSASPISSSRCRRSNVPAEGNDIFPTPNLTIDIPEDRWVRAIEIRPSNREVTHHSVLFMAGGSAAAWLGSRDSSTCSACGPSARRQRCIPKASAAGFARARSFAPTCTITRTARRRPITTRVGLYFGRGELKKEVASAVAGDISFKIPAGAKNHEMRALFVIDQDINIVLVLPAHALPRQGHDADGDAAGRAQADVAAACRSTTSTGSSITTRRRRCRCRAAR